MRKLSAVAFVIITTMITAPLPAIAYTQADADACKPDAMRLCASAMTRSLLDARNRAIVPLLPAMKSGGEVDFDNGVLSARWAAGAKILELLAKEIGLATKDPKIVQRLTELGIVPGGTVLEDFTNLVDSQRPGYAEAVKASGLKPIE